MSIFTGPFWKATAERAIKTFAQVAAATLTATATGLLDADWLNILSVAGLAAVYSVLTSVGSDALTKGSGPSLTNSEVLPRD